MDTLVIQQALLDAGFDPKGVDGDIGPNTRAALRAFQKARKLPVTGEPDRATVVALSVKMAGKESVDRVPALWMPAADMARIIVHWTAGAHKASGLDRAHYHILIEGDGAMVRGIPSIKLNQDPIRKGSGYAAHTLNCNSGSIGVSLCCMAEAKESPFDAGKAPMTKVQWDALPAVLATLCTRYGIAVAPQTVLSHAEVQGTLGIKQRGKWDIARLAFDRSVVGAKACGDLFRAATQALM